MDRPPEFAGETLASFAADKARGEFTQVLEDRPEEFFRHLGRAHLVGDAGVGAPSGRGLELKKKERRPCLIIF
jgi:hypothetical protein